METAASMKCMVVQREGKGSEENVEEEEALDAFIDPSRGFRGPVDEWWRRMICLDGIWSNVQTPRLQYLS
jgi:hypothetical protein